MEQELVQTPQGAYWCFAITYILGNKPYSDRPKKVDYKQVLDDASFARFTKLREIRKKRAKEEGIPAFTIFTDEELSNLAKIEILTLQNMKHVKGVGEKKVAKFGAYFMLEMTDKDEKSN